MLYLFKMFVLFGEYKKSYRKSVNESTKHNNNNNIFCLSKLNIEL